jgi:hypothetical protein
MTEDIVEVPYGDLYLKFADEAEAVAALAGYESSIDVLGDVEGFAGYLVNTRGPMTPELLAFAVDPPPAQPIRIWA